MTEKKSAARKETPVGDRNHRVLRFFYFMLAMLDSEALSVCAEKKGSR